MESHVKIPKTSYPVNKLITHRWSARAFDQKPITKDILLSIFEAASWAPSAMNEQPWRYIAASKDDKVEFNRILDCLLPANAGWAKNAACLIVSYAKIKYTSSGAPNVSALHDTGMANQNLLLQAASLNISGHVMGGYIKEKVIETFGIGTDYEPVCIIALGYHGDPDTLSEPFKTRELEPRKRKSLDEFVQGVI